MKLHDLFNRQKSALREDPRSFPEDGRFVANELVGVEVEVENYELPMLANDSPLKFWDREKDGSLRNNGKEFKSKVPLSGSDLAYALVELEEHLRTFNALTNFRTGLHVHLDIRDLHTYQICTLSSLYFIFEDALFVYADRRRKSSNFCPSMEYSCRANNWLADIIAYGGETLGPAIADWPKYSAVNLHSAATMGSMEFRQHPGTFQPEEIAKWINIILKMKMYVKNRSWKEFISTVFKLTGRELLNEVFDDLAYSLDYWDLDNDVNRRMIKVKAFNCKPKLSKTMEKNESRSNSLFQQLYGNGGGNTIKPREIPFGIYYMGDCSQVGDDDILQESLTFLRGRDYLPSNVETELGRADILELPNNTYILESGSGAKLDWVDDNIDLPEDEEEEF